MNYKLFLLMVVIYCFTVTNHIVSAAIKSLWDEARGELMYSYKLADFEIVIEQARCMREDLRLLKVARFYHRHVAELTRDVFIKNYHLDEEKKYIEAQNQIEQNFRDCVCKRSR